MSAAEEEKFLFIGENNQRADIEFWSPGNISLSELTLGSSGDLEVVEITGLAKEQIRQSMLNAVRAFTWQTDERNINLIVMETDNKEDIDICDALFGTECEIIRKDAHSWSRKDDGLFCQPDFSNKVAGVIAIKRKRDRNEEISSLSPEQVVSRLSAEESEFTKTCGMRPETIKKALELKTPTPIADYNRMLYMNNRFKHLHEDIGRLLSFDKIVYYDMRPPMGNSNFGLSR